MTVYHGFAAALFVVALLALVWCAHTRGGKWVGWALLAVASLVLWMVAGCSTIDRRVAPPADWPELRVVIHQKGFMGKAECNGMIGGCSVPDFCLRRCNIYLQVDLPFVEAHERAHCAGYDHPGDDTMKRAWADYKRMDGPGFCRMRMGDANYCRLHGCSTTDQGR